MTNEIDPNNPASNLPAEDIVIDAFDPLATANGVMELAFDPEKAQSIISTDHDLLIIDENGTTHIFENFVDAMSNGVLLQIMLQDGTLNDPIDLLELGSRIEDLADTLNDRETASGQDGLSALAAIPQSGFTRLEVEDLGGAARPGASATFLNERGEQVSFDAQFANRLVGLDEFDQLRPFQRLDETDGLGEPVTVSEDEILIPDTIAAAPELILTGTATGSEGGNIALDILANLSDTDGSETLSVRVAGLPEGASLSAGIVNDDGTVTVTPDDLREITVNPAPFDDQDFTLVVTAISQELAADGSVEDTASVTRTIAIEVTGVANTPTVEASVGVGLEDTAIALSIEAALTDTDGSETLSITIADVPNGAVLSAGIDNGDGTYTLTEADLDGLTITPPANSGEDFSLTVNVTATESNGDTATSTAIVPVIVTSVADAPDLTVTSDVTAFSSDNTDETITATEAGTLVGAGGSDILTGSDGNDTITGDGDSTAPIAAELNLAAAFEGQGALSFSLSNLPDGATLSAGIVEDDGTVTLTPDEAASLTLVVPPGTPDFQINVTATVTETDPDSGFTSQNTDSAIIDITVDETNLAGDDVLDGQDGDDTLTGGAGSDVVLGGDGDDLIIQTGLNADDDFDTLIGGEGADTLQLDLTSAEYSDPDILSDLRELQLYIEGGSVGTLTLDNLQLELSGIEGVSLIVDGTPRELDVIAEAPTLTVSDAAGDEDTAIALDISAALTDTDGSETLSLTLSGVPDGAVVSAGTDNGDGTVTLTADDLAGLTITPPADSVEDFTLTVTATSTEIDGDTASTIGTIDVDVTGTAAEASLTLAGTGGLEDQDWPLTIDISGLEGSDTASITVAGMPDGATLSAGIDNGDGTWTLTTAQLDGLILSPTADSADDFTLTVSVTTTDSESGDTATVTETLDITLTGVADAPTLTLGAAAGDQDTAIALDISSALTDTDGSESLSITLSGVPNGATVSAGTDNGDGTVTLTADDLAGLTITPPADSVTDFTLTVTATSTEADGDTATTTGTIDVDVTGTAAEATLTASDAAGTEDTAIALNIDVTGVEGSDTASITISGVPTGATLSAGTDNGDGTVTLTVADLDGLTITPPADSSADFSLGVSVTTTDDVSGDTATVSDSIDVAVTGDADAPTLTLGAAAGDQDTAIALDISSALTDTDGSESLSITLSGVPNGATVSAGTDNGDGTVTLTADDLAGLTITPPSDSVADFTLTVTATSTEADGDTATTTGTIDVDVTGTAAEATLTASDAAGTEDTAIALNIDVTGVEGSDTASITISGVPTGATLSAGTDNGDGTVTLTVADLDGLTITPPTDSSADFSLGVSVTTTDDVSGDTATVSDSIDVAVTGDADAPTLTLGAAAGDQDTAIALDISSALTDTDGSESLSITLSGVPSGATVSAGTDNGDGTVTLTADDLAGLTITPPADSVADFTLTVTATSTEADGDTATTTGTIDVDVTGTAAEATLTASDAAGTEDTAIALNIDVTGVEGSDTASITISGVPTGATLSNGTDNGDGTVTLTVADLDGLTITPPTDSSADFSLGVSVTTTDDVSGDTATVSDSIDVAVTGDADAPTLTLGAAAGDQDTAIALDISSALTDTDGSESLSITLSGVPNGATVSAGTDNGDGTVTLTADDLAGLTITPPADSVTDFTLTVTATSTEADGDTATTTGTIDVDVTGTAAEATLTASDAAGTEDTAIALNIDVTGVEGSDTASITISGVPTGATLSAGTDNGDGTVTLTVADLDGLTITPPADSSADFSLGVSVTTTDDVSGDTATVSDSIDVAVTGDADAPTLTLGAAAGDQDTAIALDISSALTDTDGSESLSITLSGVPNGATVSAGTDNGDGTVTLTADDLAGLTITPPSDSVADFTLTVTATSTEADGDTATTTGTIDVDVTGTAAEATLTASDAAGTEDTAIALNIDVTGVEGSDTASITISGVPTGATLSNGTDNGDGTVTLTVADLDGLTITPPADSSADFSLGVSVTTTDDVSGDTATVSDSIDVAVTGDADAPTLTLGAAAGDQDTAIALDISSALTDTDGSESLSITLSGVPSGATVSAGTDNGDGTVTLTADDLAGLTITPPADSVADFTLTVTATSTEADGDTATTTGTIDVDVTGTAAEATLTASDAAGTEDTAIALNIDVTGVEGSDTASITISGVPTGATLSAGTDNGDNTYTLTVGQLDGLTITPPSDSSVDFTLGVSVTTTDTVSGDTATVTDSVDVTVAGDADAARLTGTSGTPTVSTSASTVTTTTIDGTNVDSTSAGFTVTARTIMEDGTMSAESADYVSNTDVGIGTAGGATMGSPENQINYDANTGQSEELIFRFDEPASSADVSFMRLFATEGRTGETGHYEVYSNGVKVGDGTFQSETGESHNLTIALENSQTFDQIVFTSGTESFGSDYFVEQVDFTTGSEGTTTITYPLEISATLTDSSETLSDITITGIPTGATLSAGTVNGDGSVTLTSAELSGLSITTPTSETDFDLTLSVTTTDGSDTQVTTSTLSVEFPEVQATTLTADTGTATTSSTPSTITTVLHLDPGTTSISGDTVTDQSGNSDGTMRAGANDTSDGKFDRGFSFDGNNDHIEVASTAANSPTEGTFSAWIKTTDSRVSIASKEAEESDSGGDFSLYLYDGQLGFYVEDSEYSFDIGWDANNSPLNDGEYHHVAATWDSNTITLYADGVEVLSYDLPSDFEGVMVNNDNPWTFGAAQWSREEGDTSTEDLEYELDGVMDDIAVFNGVLDASDIATIADDTQISSFTPQTGIVEATDLPLDITLGTVQDGSEVTITIDGIPDGATLTADGTEITVSGGSASLTSGQLSNLVLSQDSSASDEFDLTVTATTTNGLGSSAVTASTITVNSDLNPETTGDGSGQDELGTVSFWNFSETEGTTVADTVGNSDGTAIGSQMDMDVTGSTGSGIDMTYDDNLRVEVAHNDSLNLSEGTITISFKDDQYVNDTLLSKGDPGSDNGSFELRTDGANVKLEYRDQSGTVHELSGGSTTLNEFNTATFSFGPEGLKLFVNGTEVASKSSVTDGINGNTDTFKIGINEDNWDDFNGVVDDVAIFDNQLSDTNIQSLHDNGVQSTIDSNASQEAGVTLSGGENGDILTGGENVDIIAGGAGDDTLAGGAGDDTIQGGKGDDTLAGGAGGDKIKGGSGNDTVSYAESAEGVVLNFATGTYTGGDAEGDSIWSVENVIGSDQADTITGDSGDNVITGGAGDDTIDGGAGEDTIAFDEATGSVTVDLGAGTVTGADGSDIVANIENVTGSSSADDITGDSGDNVIDGRGGADTLEGGGGADTFKLSMMDGTVDTIADFNAAEGDILDVSDLVTVAEGDAISDYIRLEEDGEGNTVLQVDTSGSGEDENFEDVAVLQGSVDLNIDEVVQVQTPTPEGG